MRRSSKLLILASGLCGAIPAFAGGFLWLSREFAAPASIQRYNLTTNMFDMTVQPMFGGNPITTGDVINNLAVNGNTLYLGSDDDQTFATAHALDAVVKAVGSYAPPVASSSFEDGSYNATTGTLWRSNYGNVELIQTSTLGAVLTTATVAGHPGNLDGLEWVGNTLFCTGLDTAVFGRINNPLTATPSFTQIPLTGIPSTHYYGGLAYDQQDGILYMATTTLSNAFLWRVDPVLGTAVQAADLTAVGYPTGFVLPDAMGWVAPEPSSLLLLGLVALPLLRRRG